MLRHARSGKAFVIIRSADGKRRQVTLGPWGSGVAQRGYHAELVKWHARQRSGEEAAAMAAAEPASLTIAGAVARWTLHTEAYYRHPDGTPTSEVQNCREAVRPLLDLFGDEPAAEFGPKKLRDVRDRMIHGDPTVPAMQRRTWCRPVANKAIGRIRSCFRWLAAEELTPASVHASLCALQPLKRGRTDAREPKPTKPVSDADFEATIRELPPVVRDMCTVQRLVGMRGGELVMMTSAELDRSGNLDASCWVFRPSRTKVSYRGREISYAVGPQAVEILKRYLKADPHAYLFSPAESEAQRRALQRARRQSKVQPSQVDRSKDEPKKRPGECYDVRSYGHAIRYACKRAGVDVWGPHSLRRAAATRIRSLFGAEAARAALAHGTLDMAALYGHRDLKSAIAIAAKIG